MRSLYVTIYSYSESREQLPKNENPGSPFEATSQTALPIQPIYLKIDSIGQIVSGV